MVFLCNLHISDGLGNLSEYHFGNIACGKSDSVYRGRGIKIDNVRKIFGFKILSCIQTATAHQHKSYAVHRKPLIDNLNIEVVKFL